MENILNKKSNNRINFIDTLRGFSVISMVIYHFLYDLIIIYGLLDINLKVFYPFQQFICWTFIIISGISFNLSSNNLKSSIKLIGIALLISLVTYIFMGDYNIKFGIIHLLGFSSLILSIIGSDKFSMVKLVLYFLIFIIFWSLEHYQYPLYSLLSTYNLYPLGYPGENFYSSDYFPLIPWFFLYIFGYQLGGILINNKNIIKKYDFNIEILALLGRNSLLIYIIHQPILLLIIEIFTNIL